MMQIHSNIEIRGRVQGVGFRMGAAHKARQLGLTGWVTNTDTGGVLIEAEGSPEVVDVFVEWCKQGTALSRVDEVLINPGKIKNYQEFSIRK